MKKLILAITALFLLVTVFPQNNKIPVIGSEAPSFAAQSTNGKLTFPDDFGKSWKILFSHPKDFTPVCSTELLELAFMSNYFDKLGIKLAILSTDDLSQHYMWKTHLEQLDYKGRGPQKIGFPIIDDHKMSASKKYGMLHGGTSTSMTIRGVYIIDPDNIIRSINFYPIQVGRNMKEIVRTIEALQTSDKSEVLMPANWKSGEDVLVPYLPYNKNQLVTNPELKDQFYQVGDRMWFKKVDK